ncbi:MAG: hypothetical protein ACFCVA_06335 [Gammaproteobacteria bacterium]
MAGQNWDRVVTLDEATYEHNVLFCVEEDGTASSFNCVRFEGGILKFPADRSRCRHDVKAKVRAHRLS